MAEEKGDKMKSDGEGKDLKKEMKKDEKHSMRKGSKVASRKSSRK